MGRSSKYALIDSASDSSYKLAHRKYGGHHYDQDSDSGSSSSASSAGCCNNKNTRGKKWIDDSSDSSSACSNSTASNAGACCGSNKVSCGYSSSGSSSSSASSCDDSGSCGSSATSASSAAGSCSVATRTDKPLNGTILFVANKNRRTTKYTWKIPSGVHQIWLTMAGGGGAGGCQFVDGSSITNGTGGQGGASFINRPMLVTPGQEIKFFVGNGGVPSCLIPASGPPGGGAAEFSSFSGILEDRALPPPTQDFGLTISDGAPTYICFDGDCITNRATLFASGGLSGDHALDPSFAVFSAFGGFAGQPGEAGDSSGTSAGDTLLAKNLSSRALFPISPLIPGQGGSTPFAAGGIPMVTPFPETAPVSFSNGNAGASRGGAGTGAKVGDGRFSPYGEAIDTNGDLGSGGAGQTTSYQAGFGGPGFVSVFW